MSKPETKRNESRREFVKKAAYVAPAILTLTAASSFARAASVQPTIQPLQPKRPG